MSGNGTRASHIARTPGERGAYALHVQSVTSALATSWMATCSEWIAEEHRHITFVDSPIGRLVAKRDSATGAKRCAIRYGLRRPRTLRAFHLGHALLAVGLPTPEPVAWLGGPLDSGASVLLTRYRTADDPWDFLRTAPDAHEQLFELMARRLAELHAEGFRHRDLKAPNILISRDGAHGMELDWIDLDGLHLPGTLRASHRRRDLARLCASFASPAAARANIGPGDWSSFLERYLRHAGLSPGVQGDWEERTQRWAHSHVQANVRRDRPLF